MASFLYRLGRFAFRRRWLVTGLWLAVLAAALTGAAALSGPTSGALRIPGTPSQEAIGLLQERFPQASAGGATARVVLRQAPQVVSVTDPFSSGAVNQAGVIGFAQATYRVAAQDLTDGDRDALDDVPVPLEPVVSIPERVRP